MRRTGKLPRAILVLADPLIKSRAAISRRIEIANFTMGKPNSRVHTGRDQPMIQITGLSKVYGRQTALEDFSVTVASGEIVGVLGPNGAGKSTLIKILAGIILPTAGSALVAGFDILHSAIEVKRRVGYLPESASFFDSLSALEYVDFVARLHRLESRTAHQRRDEIFDLLKLGGGTNKPMAQLSKGTRQKVALCAALIHRPNVLLLDEPFDGLDIEAAMIVRELLRQLAACAESTVLLSSHMVSTVEELATTVLIMNDGRRLACDTPDQLSAAVGATTLEDAFRMIVRVEAPSKRVANFIAAHQD